MYKLVLVGLMVLTLPGCWTLKDYGSGKCREYKPSCWGGDPVCETDKKGCVVCTCVPRNGSFPQKYP